MRASEFRLQGAQRPDAVAEQQERYEAAPLRLASASGLQHSSGSQGGHVSTSDLPNPNFCRLWRRLHLAAQESRQQVWPVNWTAYQAAHFLGDSGTGLTGVREPGKPQRPRRPALPYGTRSHDAHFRRAPTSKRPMKCSWRGAAPPKHPGGPEWKSPIPESEDHANHRPENPAA